MSDQKMKFKTNIKCDGCIAAVSPALNEAVGAGNWQVDLTDPRRVLTLPDQAPVSVIQSKLAVIGYTAEPI